ncbi:MAG TPA: hypothetical protein VFB16_12070, partial [Bauldia sp.]|nr:hypothetical protein [Bauldia sp.]
MHLDVATLMAAGAFTTGMSSLLLVLAWLADRRALTFLWWSAGNLLIAAGILLLFLFAGEPGGLGNVAAAIALAIGPTFLWTATRTFQGRRPQFLAMAAGPA